MRIRLAKKCRLIPESEVSVNFILCDVAPKVDCPVEDLTILDSTLVPQPDECRGKLLISYFNRLGTILTYCRYRVLVCLVHNQAAGILETWQCDQKEETQSGKEEG